ncbi:MAG TPA: class I adenylate-forming enzyme family protein [Bauldia sp.]|nr:class I adenylate-forming enzyme family protein [Bauldia sp.]
MLFAQMISHHAASYPGRPAVILADRIVTYGMLEAGIGLAAERLAAGGLRPGDVAGIVVANPARHLALIYALYRLGVPSVSLRGAGDAATPGLDLTVLVTDAAADTSLRQVVVDDAWFAEAPEGAPPAPRETPFGPDDVWRIALSSGTTGVPKPVWFSPRQSDARMATYILSLGAAGGWDRVVCPFGLFIGWGAETALVALAQGKSLLFPQSARETLQMISVFSGDVLMCSTNHLQTLLDLQREGFTPLPSLRQVYSGGAPFSPQLIAEVQAKICGKVVFGFGTTEVGAVTLAPVDRLPVLSGATGYVWPWIEMEIVDEAGSVLPAGEEGVMRIRSPQQGWFGDRPRPGAPPGPDLPWFYPGDRALMQPDGMVVVTGRVSEIINIGGVKLPPDLIEMTIRSHPLVADAGAIGAPSPAGIDEIRVAVVARGPVSEAELAAHLTARVPGVHGCRIVFVDAVPRTGSGKAVRPALRALLGA